jgi:hypothetical protein
MRALRWPDAFPKEDIAVRNRLGGVSAMEAEALSQAWRPWRSYAVMQLWGMARSVPGVAVRSPRRFALSSASPAALPHSRYAARPVQRRERSPSE